MAKSDKEGYGAHGCHTPPAFTPVLILRLRIASGGYDCRRECACTSGWLPLTSHHSYRKMICPVGRHFLMQPLRGRHTPSRHHAVCTASIPLRPSTTGDGLKALSYAPRHPPPPSAPRRKDSPAHSIALHSHLSSLATSIIPPFIDQRCEHIIYCPRPKPLGVEGSVLEAMSAMPGCLRSDGRPRYWKESVPMHSDTAALTFNHSYRKIACLAAHCVGAHPYGAAHTLSLARPTSLHFATIGFADAAPLHYVALARRTCWLSHFCRQSDIAMLMTFLPH